MPRRYSDNHFTPTSKVTPETFNPVVAELDKAIASLENFRVEWQEQVGLFNANALKRVNDAVAPIIDQISSAIDGGFLVAETNDLVAIVEGAEINFFIPPAARVAYRPTPFLAIMAPNVYDDWAIGRTLAYNADTGLLTVEILHLNGSGAARTGWVISASSGVVEAVSTWLGQVSAMRTEIIAARTTVLQKAAEVNAAAIIIAGGPVSSVNGLTGAVTGVAMAANHYTKVAMDEMFSLTATALAEKADGAATAAALANKANASDVATALAGKTSASDVLEEIHAYSLIV